MRVIAGALRGRRLRAPRGRDTRPTPDRVREALFAALEPLEGLRVLDLYAGSGALGIEALSRGAAHLVLVERSHAALSAVRDNLAELGIGAQAIVLGTALERSLAAISELGPYDLVLADPPYADVASERVTPLLDRLLADRAVLRPSGLVVIEHAARDRPPELRAVRLVRTRTYGDTALSWYAPGAEEASPRA